MAYKAILAGSLAFLLAACQRDVELAIEQRPDGVYAVATAPDGAPACVKALAVREGAHDSPPIWRIASAPSDPCTSRFRLGEIPPGFAADDATPNLRLSRGQSYNATVSGPGFLATTTFTAGRD